MNEDQPIIINVPDKWQIGAHTGFSGNICDTLMTSIDRGMYSTQFFLGSPQSFKRANISISDILKCQKLLKRFPLHIFTHFPYVANLAGSKAQLAWEGDSIQDGKTHAVLNGIEHELNILSQIKCKGKNCGVVIHPGTYKNREVGLDTIAKSINKIKFKGALSKKEDIGTAQLLLENSAGQGDTLATTFEEIKLILNGVEEKKRRNIGICIDTCHAYAYGLYDLSKVSEVEKMFADFDELIGLKYLKLIHLNDSECKYKSRKDRHALLGHGEIWRDNFDSLIVLLNKCTEYNIPLVLETHCIDMLTVSKLAEGERTSFFET